MGFKFCIIFSLLLMLSSCAQMVSQRLHTYRYFPGTYETNGKEADHTDLIYYGKKHESLESAAYKWHQFAAEKCFNQKYEVTGTSALEIRYESAYIEDLMVYFAEPGKWPQVYASYRCEWPR